MKPKTLEQIEEYWDLMHLYIGLDQYLYERDLAIEHCGIASVDFHICDKYVNQQEEKVIDKEETVLSLARLYSLKFIPKYIRTKRRSK